VNKYKIFRLKTRFRVKVLRAKFSNKLSMFVVWNILPERIIYWASIRMIAYATGGKYGSTIVPELSAMDALGRWEDLMSNG